MEDRSREWTLWYRSPSEWVWGRGQVNTRLQCERAARMIRQEYPHCETLVLPPGETPYLHLDQKPKT